MMGDDAAVHKEEHAAYTAGEWARWCTDKEEGAVYSVRCPLLGNTWEIGGRTHSCCYTQNGTLEGVAPKEFLAIVTWGGGRLRGRGSPNERAAEATEAWDWSHNLRSWH